MSVLECSRHECENIMCSTYFSGIGYLCDECKEEFKDYLKSQFISIDAISLQDFYKHLNVFITTKKGHFVEGETKSVDDHFQDFTKKY